MCHVLIIEDEPFVAMSIQATLEDEGATSFDIAVTQEDAVAAAMSHRPELITSDVRLARGTGPAAVQEIHRRLGMVPVIFISGTPEECQPCNPPGIVLPKPLRRGALESPFHQLL
ncbi:response regulator [Sphingomonas sp. MA1305]|jgi:CheY-like chemotaxis protein|uniref:response regulator n=2 Tax=unclassified Sphingomonas TaxID=196159 RepID=UPI0018DFD0E0|nr:MULTISPECIES: response regulator [unclassified Sphingomonas]MBI0477015.1 response regulator [Sphingomonas sp. MA1305]MCP4025484.1 response regulator [Sphingomonas sp.]